MAEHTLGIQELIERVKEELRQPPRSEAMFEIGQVELEISFTVEKTAEGGIDLRVIQAGGQRSTSDVQTIRVQLNPLNPESPQWKRRVR